ncbi:MAG: extracellular solute-binding protein [Firmicutes bacterium]|jgi:ABC-type glycerol-3-phosphate transport system substrate-binding protein|nr:extracellular solute-binding protein [Bacillota bacterium]
MSKNRSLVVCVAALVLLAAVPAQARIELTMVTHWNTAVTQGALLQQYIDEYNSLQDEVHITLISDPAASGTEKIFLWHTAGTMPDILPVSQVNIPQFVQSGIISPMPDHIIQVLEENFLPGALQLTSHRGQIWGYPTENMPNAFTYDLIDFNNKGIGDQFPETWEELLAVAQRLTEYDGEGNITRAGFGWNQDFRRNIAMLMVLTWREGGELFTDNDTKVHFTSEPVQRAVNFLTEIVHERNIVRYGGNHSHSVQAIRWAPGPYVRSSILAESGPERLAEIRSARLPLSPDGKRTVPNYGWVIAVPTATPYKEQVHDFLIWLTTDVLPDGTTRMGNVLTLLGSIPNTLTDIYSQPVLQDPFMAGFVAPMMDNDVRSWPMPPNSNGVFSTMNRAISDILNQVDAPMNILTNLQSQVQQLIDEAWEQ